MTEQIIITVASRAGVGKTTVSHGLVAALKAAGFEVELDQQEHTDAMYMENLPQKFTDLAASGRVKVRVTSAPLRRDGTMYPQPLETLG